MGNEAPKKLKENIVFKMFSSQVTGIMIIIKKLISNFFYVFKNIDYFLFLNSNHNFFQIK